MKESRKKKTIMDQSKQLFERFGYQKTTLTDIAKSLGNVKSAIYYYFSGKEEIFAALVQSEANDFLKKLIARVESSNDPIKQLHLYVDARVELMMDVTRRYHFLKNEFFELMPVVEENRKDCDTKEVAFLKAILDKANDLGHIQTENTAFTASLLMQNIKGLEVQMFVTDTLQAHLEDREAFVDFILYGILNKKS